MFFWEYLGYECSHRDSKPAIDWVKKKYQERGWTFTTRCFELALFTKKPVYLHLLERTDKLDADPTARLLLVELAFAEADQDRFTVLDGKGPTIAEVVLASGGLRESPGVPERYVELFCGCVLAEEGNLMVVRDAQDVVLGVNEAKSFELLRLANLSRYLGKKGSSDGDTPLPEEGLAAISEKLKSFASAVEAPPMKQLPDETDDTPAITRWECLIVYANTVFTAKFRLDSRTGELDMLDEETIAVLGATVTTRNVLRSEDSYPFFKDQIQFKLISASDALESIYKSGVLRGMRLGDRSRHAACDRRDADCQSAATLVLAAT